MAYANSLGLASTLDQDSDYSDNILTAANKKAKRSERKPTRRSPRLHSEDEEKPAKTGRTGRRGRRGEAHDDDEFSDEDDGRVDTPAHICPWPSTDLGIQETGDSKC